MQDILENAVNLCSEFPVEEDAEIPVKDELKKIVWFLTPKQAAVYLKVRNREACAQYCNNLTFYNHQSLALIT